MHGIPSTTSYKFDNPPEILIRPKIHWKLVEVYYTGSEGPEVLKAMLESIVSLVYWFHLKDSIMGGAVMSCSI